jgi:hypothetical protein
MQRRLLLNHRRFVTIYRSIWHFPETSVTRCTLHNIPEGRRSHLHHAEIQKSRRHLCFFTELQLKRTAIVNEFKKYFVTRGKSVGHSNMYSSYSWHTAKFITRSSLFCKVDACDVLWCLFAHPTRVKLFKFEQLDSWRWDTIGTSKTSVLNYLTSQKISIFSNTAVRTENVTKN